MTESDSDIERLSSVGSTIESFDVVPHDQEFKFKLFTWTGKLLVKFIYPLKKGKDLPYTRELKGRSTKVWLKNVKNYASFYWSKMNILIGQLTLSTNI